MTEPAMKPSVVLDKAADLISPPGAWTQRFMARARPGARTELDPLDPDAACFCAIGAIRRAAGGDQRLIDTSIATVNVRALGRVGISRPLWKWNDASNRRQEQVVAVLRKAADLARADGQ